jgi:hypothetical protein
MESLENDSLEPVIRERPERNPQRPHLEKGTVVRLLQKIREGHPDTVVLKLKDHIPSDTINPLVCVQ